MNFITNTMLGASINHVIDKSRGGNGYVDNHRKEKAKNKVRVKFNGEIDTRTDLQRCLTDWSR